MSPVPYADRVPVHRTLPEHGLPRDEVLGILRSMASEEDATWETGKCSGTMYCGDHDHYDFLNEAFSLFSHVNVLQRDMCPSATRFESEIIAMTLDLLHADAVEGSEPVGLVSSGGTGSICHALLAYRDHAAATRGVDRPNVIKPETAHPAFDKACHLFGIELRVAPVDPVTTRVDTDWVAGAVDDATVALIGSACNYGYGTVDPIEALSDIALERGIGLHVDGCLGGWILPFGQELGYDIPRVRLPGPRGDVHLRRHPQVRLRPEGDVGPVLPGQVPAQRPVLLQHRLERRQVLLARAWTARARAGCWPPPGPRWSSSGREGYRGYAEQIFATSAAMQAAVRSHPELRILGDPTFLFSFTSDEFDIYHVNDFLRTRGWRFNGQQYPNALHMAVTRPQTAAGRGRGVRRRPGRRPSPTPASTPPRRPRRAPSTAAWPVA